MKGKGADQYDDLREAIRTHAFVRAADGNTIVGSERTGAQEAWIFDLRAILLRPEWLDRYAEIFWELYEDHLPFQVAGVESAGIPLVAAIVMKSKERGTPVNGLYVRKSRKRIGLMKYVEGTPTTDPVIFVDDLINSGATALKEFDVLEKEGLKVSDLFTILAFRRDEAYGRISKRGVKLRHLFTLEDFDLPLREQRDGELPAPYKTLWHYKAPSPSFHLVVEKSAPVTDGERVYFGRDDGTFVALDVENGNEVWSFAVGKHPTGKGILSSPLLHDGNVFFGAYDGTVYALDTKTGTIRWKYEDADWVGSSPDISVSHGLLYIGLEYGLWRKRGGIAALDIHTGAPRWSATHQDFTHGSPLFIENESLVVIGSNDGYIYAYDATSGALKWKFQCGADVKGRPAYVKESRQVVVCDMSGRAYGLSVADGSPVHAREMGAGIYSSPLVDGDTIYIASLDKCVYALDADTWKDRWIFETSGRIFSSPIVRRKDIWIGSNDGRLYRIDATTGKAKDFFQTTERIVNAPVFLSDKILVPTVANELFALEFSDK